MKYKQSLRRRITLSFLLFGTLLSMVITIGVYFAIEDIEKELVEGSLKSEMDFFLKNTNQPLGSTRQVSAKIILYYVNDAQKKMVPDIIRDLPVGHHDLEYDQYLYHIFIANNGIGTIYLIKDATTFEQREMAIHTALIASIISAILIAWWLGSGLSSKIISPVSNLARQVAERKPNRRTPTRINNTYADDEVGQLAVTFDHYLEHLEKFIEREQEFTANASHELRTPLTVINGAAELLLDNPQLPDRVHRQIERIARAGNRMSQMIEVLLLLARESQPDKEDETKERCSLKEICLEVCEQHQFLTHNKMLTLRSNVIHDFNVEAPKAIIAILLGNLVRNALIYTQKGEVVITVNAGQITIKDTGPGIPEEQLKKIFQRHYRSHESRGNGIGLAIVKRICERQQWQIEIKSEVGNGTIVFLDFSPHPKYTRSD